MSTHVCGFVAAVYVNVLAVAKGRSSRDVPRGHWSGRSLKQEGLGLDMASSQGAATARERLRRISSSIEPSVITLHRNSLSNDVSADVRSARRSTDTEHGLREPLLSPFAEQEPPQPPQDTSAGAEVQW